MIDRICIDEWYTEIEYPCGILKMWWFKYSDGDIETVRTFEAAGVNPA